MHELWIRARYKASPKSASISARLPAADELLADPVLSAAKAVCAPNKASGDSRRVCRIPRGASRSVQLPSLAYLDHVALTLPRSGKQVLI